MASGVGSARWLASAAWRLHLVSARLRLSAHALELSGVPPRLGLSQLSYA
jgi:hypothetical protein